VHLEIEKQVAAFLGAEEAILYSDALACVSSVIPAFAKKGDTIIVDDSVNFGIQQGCLLSRSTIHYFKHNDMADLERVLESLAKAEAGKGKSKGKSTALLHRKFIVCEGISSIYGDIAPLAELVQLKHRYAYRLIVDDSLGFGTIGATGRGSTEHAGVKIQGTHAAKDGKPGVDILCAAMDGALASVGGFCVGNHQVVDHQRLSGAGYCFSASSPPYTSTASITSLHFIATQPQLGAQLRSKASKLRHSLEAASKHLVVLGGKRSESSPVIHVAVKGSDQARWPEERDQLQEVVDLLRETSSIVISVPEFIPADRVRVSPTLRIVVSVVHQEADLEKLVKAIGAAAGKVFGR
jgi:serine palmitoyltransferase